VARPKPAAAAESCACGRGNWVGVVCWRVQDRPLQRAVDYKLFSFDFVAHVLDDAVSLEVVLKMFYGLNVVENFQVPVEVT